MTLELNDNGDKLILKNGSDEIDIVAWEDVSGWDLKADEDESIQRDPPNKDTNTDDDWKSHTNPDPDTGGLITTSSSTTTTIPVTTSTTTSSTTTTTTPTFGSLLVSVSVKNETIVRGNNQTIITMVTDGTNPIENALVNVTVKYASNEVYNWCNGLTNSTGIFICSYKIDGGSTPGTFVATSTATKDGYITGIGNVSFEVIAAS